MRDPWNGSNWFMRTSVISASQPCTDAETRSRSRACLAPVFVLHVVACRDKDAEAKLSAAQAKNPSLKHAFEDVASGAGFYSLSKWSGLRLRTVVPPSEAMSTFIPVDEMARSG